MGTWGLQTPGARVTCSQALRCKDFSCGIDFWGY